MSYMEYALIPAATRTGEMECLVSHYHVNVVETLRTADTNGTNTIAHLLQRLERNALKQSYPCQGDFIFRNSTQNLNKSFTKCNCILQCLIIISLAGVVELIIKSVDTSLALPAGWQIERQSCGCCHTDKYNKADSFICTQMEI